MLYVEFRCNIVCVMLTRVGGKCSGGAGACSVWLSLCLYVSSVGVAEGLVYKSLYGRGVLECVLQVNGCRC